MFPLADTVGFSRYHLNSRLKSHDISRKADRDLQPVFSSWFIRLSKLHHNVQIADHG